MLFATYNCVLSQQVCFFFVYAPSETKKIT